MRLKTVIGERAKSLHFAKMAKAKIALKAAEKEYKDLEKIALEKWKMVVEIPAGKFSPQCREYFAINDKKAVIKKVGQKLYLEISTVSKTAICEALGERVWEDLKDTKAVRVASTAEYFLFTAKKQ